MSNYKKIVSRLIVLCGLLMGVLWLSQPTPALACDAACVACRHECFLEYQQCVASGAFGCDEVEIDCLNSCGT
jgi:hypothetical protein